MNKKNTIIILLVVLGALGLMWWGRSSQNTASGSQKPETTGPSSLTVAEKLYDFGTISMADGKVKKIFKIENPTNSDIDLEKVTTSCMCTAAFVVNGDSKKGPFGMESMGYVPKANEIIRAGGSVDIEVVYDPAAHGPAGVGTIDRFIYLREDSGKTLDLEIKAVVTP